MKKKKELKTDKIKRKNIPIYEPNNEKQNENFGGAFSLQKKRKKNQIFFYTFSVYGFGILGWPDDVDDEYQLYNSFNTPCSYFFVDVDVIVA